MRKTIRVTSMAGAVLTAVATVLVALPAGAASGAPLPPQSDPFYQPPAGYQNTAPGTILRSRAVDAAAFGALPQKPARPAPRSSTTGTCSANTSRWSSPVHRTH